jgi:fucose 4-O-acetylase-like acetyltransferase
MQRYHRPHRHPADVRRTHWIDNLRTMLTALFITQHALTEAITATSSSPRPLDIFIVLCKTLLPGLFYFVSGYIPSLCRSSDGGGTFTWKRTIWMLLPALLYGTAGHLMLWMVLTKKSFSPCLPWTLQWQEEEDREDR